MSAQARLVTPRLGHWSTPISTSPLTCILLPVFRRQTVTSIGASFAGKWTLYLLASSFSSLTMLSPKPSGTPISGMDQRRVRCPRDALPRLITQTPVFTSSPPSYRYFDGGTGLCFLSSKPGSSTTSTSRMLVPQRHNVSHMPSSASNRSNRWRMEDNCCICRMRDLYRSRDLES